MAEKGAMKAWLLADRQAPPPSYITEAVCALQSCHVRLAKIL